MFRRRWTVHGPPPFEYVAKDRPWTVTQILFSLALEKNLFFNDVIILNYKMSENAELLQFLLKLSKK